MGFDQQTFSNEPMNICGFMQQAYDSSNKNIDSSQDKLDLANQQVGISQSK